MLLAQAKYYRADALKMVQHIHYKFKMGSMTLHLAMFYFDLLPPDLVKTNTWHLQALTCLILSCKFVERDDDIPLIEDMMRASNLGRKTITYEQVIKNEFAICKELGWNLNQVTPYHFIKNYISQGIIYTSDYFLAKEATSLLT